jgi:hypothetical protein
MLFQLGDVTHERIGDQITLARKIAKLAECGEWEDNWVVVTEILRAKRFVILVSGSAAGEAELSAEADLSALGIKALTADGKVGVEYSKALETEITTKDNRDVTPLFRAVRLKSGWLPGRRKVGPAYAADDRQLIPAEEAEPSDVLETVLSYPDDEEDVPGS